MRKSRLLSISVLAGVLILGGCSSANSAAVPTVNSQPAASASVTPSASPTAVGSPSASAAASTVSDTGLTQPATQGPYYVSGTSQLVNGNLNPENLAGKRIKIKGYVYAGASGTSPIAGAKIEVWQADDSGSYHPNSKLYHHPPVHLDRDFFICSLNFILNG
jgi:protocatechuate 3,4-dioxygenase beta subunit